MPRKPMLYENGEYYHVFNRGCDKRVIFLNKSDASRFLKAMQLFNRVTPSISMEHVDVVEHYERFAGDESPLVTIIAYCLLPNHFHLLLRQEKEGGVSEFVKRLSGGYTNYFNKKHKRSGVLFQGKYKAKHIGTDSYLLHLSVYINVNYLLHKKFCGTSRDPRIASSLEEYTVDGCAKIAQPQEVLRHFKSKRKYKEYVDETLQLIQDRKQVMDDFVHEM